MPSFDLLFVSGATVPIWTDAKIRQRAYAQQRYRRVQAPTAPALATVVLHAVVAGVAAPLDGALGGDLFTVAVVSFAGFPTIVVPTAGQTSLITLRFAASMLGHHELCIRRDVGGAMIIHLDVES